MVHERDVLRMSMISVLSMLVFIVAFDVVFGPALYKPPT